MRRVGVGAWMLALVVVLSAMSAALRALVPGLGVAQSGSPAALVSSSGGIHLAVLPGKVDSTVGRVRQAPSSKQRGPELVLVYLGVPLLPLGWAAVRGRHRSRGCSTHQLAPFPTASPRGPPSPFNFVAT